MQSCQPCCLAALQWLQTALWERSKVQTLRRTLQQIHEQGSMDGASGQLTVDGHPVSVVYYRAGYSPDDYAGDAEWEARSAGGPAAESIANMSLEVGRLPSEMRGISRHHL